MKIELQTFIGLISLLALAKMGHAEGNCPAGFYPYNYTRDGNGNINGNQCAPIPGYISQQQPAVAPVRWASRWGAIAISSETGHVGTAANQEGKRDAKRIALHQCGAENGVSDCKISVVYDNGCAAYAWGGGKAGTGSAPTIAEASQIALNACNEDGHFCMVRYSECSLPERIQ